MVDPTKEKLPLSPIEIPVEVRRLRHALEQNLEESPLADPIKQQESQADLIDRAITNLGRTDKLLERAEKEMEMARSLLTDKEESPMTQPTDGTPWPDDPTKEKQPSLTAPLVKEYVTRIRLMEKALELAFNAIINSRYSHRQSPDLGAVLALHSLKRSYHAILQSLLEESGLLQPEDTDGKDPKGA